MPKKLYKIPEKILDNASKIIVGKRDVLEAMLVAMLSEGHVLLEGMPGVGKTLIAKTLTQLIGGEFRRIQMTPDLLPADIIGTNIYNPQTSKFILKKGPIFANTILIDELNRASPKTQSALIEAMQERQVTIEGQTLPLPTPFLVVATQTPYEIAGTYPLSEVQIDRFAISINITYPNPEEEIEILSRIDYIERAEPEPVATPYEIINLIVETRKIHVADKIKQYIIELVNTIRNNPYIKMGPSPRASIWLMKTARAYALLNQRNFIIPDDIKKLAPLVIPHRISLTTEAETEEITPQQIIQEALEQTPVPKI